MKSFGKIDFVSAQIDPTTDSLTVRAIVPNDFTHGKEGLLVPGQYVPVRVILGEQPDALLIPKSALMQTQAGDQVLVVDKDDKVVTRKVTVGQPYKDQWEIASGLEKDERVIVDGLQKVRAGQVVDPKIAKPPAATASSA